MQASARARFAERSGDCALGRAPAPARLRRPTVRRPRPPPASTPPLPSVGIGHSGHVPAEGARRVPDAELPCQLSGDLAFAPAGLLSADASDGRDMVARNPWALHRARHTASSWHSAEYSRARSCRRSNAERRSATLKGTSVCMTRPRWRTRNAGDFCGTGVFAEYGGARNHVPSCLRSPLQDVGRRSCGGSRMSCCVAERRPARSHQGIRWRPPSGRSLPHVPT